MEQCDRLTRPEGGADGTLQPIGRHPERFEDRGNLFAFLDDHQVAFRGWLFGETLPHLRGKNRNACFRRVACLPQATRARLLSES